MPRAPTRDPEGPEVEDLLVRFRQGDGSAFQDLVGAYQERVIQFFYRLCWDRDRAEDFAQELFLRLLRGARNYRPEGRLSTFIFRIATNLWIDHYRSVRPHPRLYSLDQVVVSADGDEAPSFAASRRSRWPTSRRRSRSSRYALETGLSHPTTSLTGPSRSRTPVDTGRFSPPRSSTSRRSRSSPPTGSRPSRSPSRGTAVAGTSRSARSAC